MYRPYFPLGGAKSPSYQTNTNLSLGKGKVSLLSIIINLSFSWDRPSQLPIKQTRHFLSLGTGQISILSHRHEPFFPLGKTKSTIQNVEDKGDLPAWTRTTTVQQAGTGTGTGTECSRHWFQHRFWQRMFPSVASVDERVSLWRATDENQPPKRLKLSSYFNICILILTMVDFQKHSAVWCRSAMLQAS